MRASNDCSSSERSNKLAAVRRDFTAKYRDQVWAAYEEIHGYKTPPDYLGASFPVYNITATRLTRQGVPITETVLHHQDMYPFAKNLVDMRHG